jgi:hypothetical protein
MLRAAVSVESSQLWEDVVSDLEQQFQDPMPNSPVPMEGVEPSANEPVTPLANEPVIPLANEPVIPAHEPILPLANEPVVSPSANEPVTSPISHQKPTEAVKGQEHVMGIVNTYSNISILKLAYRAWDCQRACVRMSDYSNPSTCGMSFQ